MSVSAEEVRRVASLARLALTDDQAMALTADLNGILHHMESLANVDTAGVAETVGVGAVGTPLRADAGPALEMQRPLSAIAPEIRDGLLIVPRLPSHR